MWIFGEYHLLELCEDKNIMLVLQMTTAVGHLLTSYIPRTKQAYCTLLESTRARLDKLGKNIVPSFYFFPSPFVPGSLEYIEP